MTQILKEVTAHQMIQTAKDHHQLDQMDKTAIQMIQTANKDKINKDKINKDHKEEFKILEMTHHQVVINHKLSAWRITTNQSDKMLNNKEPRKHFASLSKPFIRTILDHSVNQFACTDAMNPKDAMSTSIMTLKMKTSNKNPVLVWLLLT